MLNVQKLVNHRVGYVLQQVLEMQRKYWLYYCMISCRLILLIGLSMSAVLSAILHVAAETYCREHDTIVLPPLSCLPRQCSVAAWLVSLGLLFFTFWLSLRWAWQRQRRLQPVVSCSSRPDVWLTSQTSDYYVLTDRRMSAVRGHFSGCGISFDFPLYYLSHSYSI